MSEDAKTKTGTDLALQRMEIDGCSVITVRDGKVLLMTVGFLQKMLALAEADESKSVCAFLQSQDPQAPEVNN